MREKSTVEKFISYARQRSAVNKQQLETVQQSILAKEKSVQQQQKQRIALLGQLKQQEQSIIPAPSTPYGIPSPR